MKELQRLLEQIVRTAGCSVDQVRGQPRLRSGDVLPGDVNAFYELCGGLSLFSDSAYQMRVVGPDEFVRANPEIVGSECPGDISDSWYIVARGGGEEAISIDCSSDRLGRCHDSFWDCHGVAGECRVVALSFTEMLQRLFESRGDYLYWLADEWTQYGDAYGE